ncbi:MAG: hypothetical protein QXF45_07585 [Candidatus Caldarchaeum sp.]
MVNSLLAFNALQHNAPLALCDNEIIELDSRKAEEVLKKLLEFVEKKMKPVFYNNCVQVIDIEFKMLTNSLISLTIYDFIAKRLENSNLVRKNGKGVNVDSLLGVFESIFGDLGMQLKARFLRKEINDLKYGRPRNLAPQPAEDTTDKREEQLITSDEKRNFLHTLDCRIMRQKHAINSAKLHPK